MHPSSRGRIGKYTKNTASNRLTINLMESMKEGKKGRKKETKKENEERKKGSNERV
jgi:hypothetical protein